MSPNTNAYKNGIVIVIVPNMIQTLNTIETVITFLIREGYDPLII